MTVERLHQLFAPPTDAGGGKVQGDPNKPNWEKTRADWQALLEQEYSREYQGDVLRNNPDGTRTSLRAYSFTLGVSEKDFDEGWARQMIPLVTNVGYRLATRPVLVQNAWYRASDHKPLNDLWVLLEENEELATLDNTEIGGAWQEHVDASLVLMKEPVTMQMDADQGINWREPIVALYSLINDSPYVSTLREIQPPGDATKTSDQ